ncbi:hypothetical protein pb186bvf_000383 [Paramecium bursaria]
MKYQVLQEIYFSPRVRVEKVRAQHDNQTYIQKTFLQNKNEALNAIKVLNQTKNQFILNVIEYFENDEEQLVMIQEYCDQGDLKTFTMQHIGFKMQESIIWSILLQLAYGILELNEMGYQHRCLIPENIFLLGRTDGYQIRITDFTKASKQTLYIYKFVYFCLDSQLICHNTNRNLIYYLGSQQLNNNQSYNLFPICNRLKNISFNFNSIKYSQDCVKLLSSQCYKKKIILSDHPPYLEIFMKYNNFISLTWMRYNIRVDITTQSINFFSCIVWDFYNKFL